MKTAKSKTEKEQKKYHDIIITNFQFHSTKPRKPTPWYRAILKSIKNKKLHLYL